MPTDDDQRHPLEALLKSQLAHEKRVTDALRRIEDKIDGMDRRLKALVFDTIAEEAKIEREIGKLAKELSKVEDEIDHINHEVEDVDHEAHAIEKVAKAMAERISQGAVKNCPKCGSHVIYRAAGDHAYLGVCNACGWHVMLPKQALDEPPAGETVVKGDKSMPMKGEGADVRADSGPHDWVHAGDED